MRKQGYMKICSKFILIAIAGIISSACSSGQEQGGEAEDFSGSKPDTEQEAEITTYEATGTIVSIPPNKKQVIIKHDEIPGFMRAMTMPFNVADSSILEGIKPKDSVRLTIEYDGNNVKLLEIEPVK